MHHPIRTLALTAVVAAVGVAVAIHRRLPPKATLVDEVDRVLRARRKEHHAIVGWAGDRGPLRVLDAGLGRARVILGAPQRDRSCGTTALLAARQWLDEAGYHVEGQKGDHHDDPGSLLVRRRQSATADVASVHVEARPDGDRRRTKVDRLHDDKGRPVVMNVQVEEERLPARQAARLAAEMAARQGGRLR